MTPTRRNSTWLPAVVALALLVAGLASSAPTAHAAGAGPGTWRETTSETPPPQNEPWRSLFGSTPKIREQGVSATLLSGPNCGDNCGKVLVAGGRNAFGPSEPSAALYDPRDETWTDAGTMQVPYRYGHTATLLPNSKVLVAGGATAAGTNTAELYDPLTNTWSLIAPMSYSRVMHTATLLSDGKVLVVGGTLSNVPVLLPAIAQTEVYDPASDTWRPSGVLATARFRHTATLLSGAGCAPSCGKVLVVAGSTALTNGVSVSSNSTDRTRTATVELYDPSLNGGVGGFTSPSPPPLINTSPPGDRPDDARAGHTATRLGGPNCGTNCGKVLVVGGDGPPPPGGGSSAIFSSTQLYDPWANTWSAPPQRLSTGRTGHTATLLADGKVLVAGGRGNSGDDPLLLNGELYHPLGGAWVPTDRMVARRSGHTATLLPSGNVLALGGAPVGHPLPPPQAELYVPGPPEKLPSAGARYNPLTPARILDTRTGNGAPAQALGHGATLDLQVTGRGGVPDTGVSAVVMNVTVTEPTAESGFLIAYPAEEDRPLASNLNFTAGRTVPNLVVVKLGAGGKVSLFNGSGSVQVIADVAGWYDAP